MIYSGTITARPEDRSHLEQLGLVLGDYNETAREFVVLSCDEQSLKNIDGFFGTYVWSLTRTNGFEQASDKLKWFFNMLKVGVSMNIKILYSEPQWTEVCFISSRNKFFVVEKDRNGLSQNALVEFSSVRFLPSSPNSPYLDRFCLNGWMYVNVVDIVIP